MPPLVAPAEMPWQYWVLMLSQELPPTLLKKVLMYVWAVLLL